jgi:hypothetical protein
MLGFRFVRWDKNKIMTDKAFEKLLCRLNSTHSKYLKLLKEAEDEYKRRFGNYPAEVDDDWWIDSFCQSDSGSTLEKVLENGMLANEA